MVVDTMVFAYALLGVEEFRQDATATLEQADTISVPDSFRVEMANVLWQWIKHRKVSIETALQIMDDTESLISRTLSGENLWERALVLAAAGEPQLHWVRPGNRPALRAMARLANIKAIMDDEQEEALRRAQRLITINPHDNHGFRSIVMNRLIVEGRDEEALELAQKFPGVS